MLTRKNLLFTIIICCNCFIILSQQTIQEVEQELRYLLYLPDDYQQSKDKFPLLIFLHGVGERGTDIEKVKKHGPPMLIEKGKEFPFIVVSPQSKTEWKADHVYDLIQHLISKYKIDEDRITLTGIGYGTWDIAMSYPRIFAAIVPICGGGELSRAWRLRHTSVWGFHGAKDDVVPLSASQDMVNAIQKFNPEAKLTVYPEVYHDSWVNAYTNKELYEWIRQQKKFSYTEIKADSNQLSKYVGEYIDQNDNQISFSIENGDLYHINDLGKKQALKCFAENKFYSDTTTPIELIFNVGQNGIVNTVTIMNNNAILYKKLKSE